MNLNLGDGTTYLENVPFAQSYTNCYPEGGSYQISMEVFCCDGGADAILGYYTTVVECDGGGGGGCELPEEVVFYPSGSNQSGGALCPDGACEWNFCLGIDFDFSSLNESHCFTWDYGDGTTQTSNTPECGVHCFDQSGTYNVCFTVFCCDDPTHSVDHCETCLLYTSPSPRD